MSVWLSTIACCVALFQAPSTPEAARVIVEPSSELVELDRAIERGARWLVARQAESGAFAPLVRADACPVALTALAAWSLETPEPVVVELGPARAASDYLVRRRQADGGLYDPAHGLAVYTSGVAARALRTHALRTNDRELLAVANDVELYSRGRRAPESAVDAATTKTVGNGSDAARAARELLDGRRAELDEAERRALDFLARCNGKDGRGPQRLRTPDAATLAEAFGYEDLLPYVYLEVAPDQQIARRALAALQASFTVERNPDLTQRYGPAGFPDAQGLYYYYLVVAKTLDVHRLATLDVQGARRDAVRELIVRLEQLQRADGSWCNVDGRWWEDEPVLTTAYALLALKHCRRLLASRGP